MKIKNKILFGVVFISFLCSISLILLSLNIHSDTLFATDFIRDILYKDGSYKYWKLTPTPAFPDLFLTLIFESIFHNPIINLFGTSLVQLGILIFFTYKIINKISGITNSLNYILIFYSIIVLIFNNNHTWFLHLNNNVHFTAVLISLINLYLILIFKNKLILPLFLLTVIGMLSSKLFILIFIIPMLLTIVSIVILNKLFYKKYIIIFFTIIISTAVYYIIKDIIILNNPLLDRIPFSIESICNSFNNFLNVFIIIYKQFNIYYFILFIIYFIIINMIFKKREMISKIIYSQIHYMNHLENNTSKHGVFFLVMYLIILIPINTLGAIISGGFIDEYAFRYFLLIPILLYILFLIVIKDRLNQEIMNKFFFICSFLLIIFSILQWNRFFQTNKVIGDNPLTDREINTCIHDLRKEVDLKIGLANYWDARSTEFYSDDNIGIISTQSNLDFNFWMNSAESILNPKKFDTFINFLIVDNENKKKFDFNKENLIKFIPKEFKEYKCENISYSILFYGNKNLNNWLYVNRYNQFLMNNEFIESFKLNGDDFLKIVGRNYDNKRMATESDGEGFITYGPYNSLKQGNYKFILDYSFEDLNDDKLPNYDIVFSKEVSKVIFNGTLKRNTNNIEINITFDELLPFEFRVYYKGSGKIIINSLTISKNKSIKDTRKIYEY